MGPNQKEAEGSVDSPRRLAFLIRILSLLIAGIGFTILFYSVKQVLESRQSVGWPKVAGEIKVSRKNINCCGLCYSYWPEIQYAYKVGKKKYVGDRLAENRIEGSRSEMQAIFDRFPKEWNVDVYYEPENPSNSCLQQLKGMSGPVTGVVIQRQRKRRCLDSEARFYHDVEYSYKVAKTWFTGNRTGDNSFCSIEEMIKKYPKGAVVDVYYNPTDPGASFLKRGADFWTTDNVVGIIFSIILGLPLLVGGLLKFFWPLRELPF